MLRRGVSESFRLFLQIWNNWRYGEAPVIRIIASKKWCHVDQVHLNLGIVVERLLLQPLPRLPAHVQLVRLVQDLLQAEGDHHYSNHYSNENDYPISV